MEGGDGMVLTVRDIVVEDMVVEDTEEALHSAVTSHPATYPHYPSFLAVTCGGMIGPFP